MRPYSRRCIRDKGQLMVNLPLGMFIHPVVTTNCLAFPTIKWGENPYWKVAIMVGLAAAIFVGVFGFGNAIFGWSEHTLHEVQIGLFLSFILGILCGYKTRG